MRGMRDVYFVIMAQNLLNLIPGFDSAALPADAPLALYRRAVCDFVREIQPPAETVLKNNGFYLEVQDGYAPAGHGEHLKTVRVRDGYRLRRCTPEEEDILYGFMEAVIIPAFETFGAFVEVYKAKEQLLQRVYDIREKASLEWLRSLPPIDSREIYEAECARVGVKPLTDDEIKALSYGMEYGNYNMNHYLEEYTYDHRRYTLAQRYYRSVLRQSVLAEEERERAQISWRPEEMIECPGCRRLTAKRMLMAASFGLVCADCYDTYSDQPLESQEDGR